MRDEYYKISFFGSFSVKGSLTEPLNGRQGNLWV